MWFRNRPHRTDEDEQRRGRDCWNEKSEILLRWGVYDRILEQVNVPADGLVVDLGTGGGILPVALHQRFGCRVIGVDRNSFQLEDARQRAVDAGIPAWIVGKHFSAEPSTDSRLMFVEDDLRTGKVLQNVLNGSHADLVTQTFSGSGGHDLVRRKPAWGWLGSVGLKEPMERSVGAFMDEVRMSMGRIARDITRSGSRFLRVERLTTYDRKDLTDDQLLERFRESYRVLYEHALDVRSWEIEEPRILIQKPFEAEDKEMFRARSAIGIEGNLPDDLEIQRRGIWSVILMGATRRG